jgi:nitroimidazol reductase NimA-like FMN-containing flavoprotein (pyridoxamine 5'-phosphate oxidase superfamily)
MSKNYEINKENRVRQLREKATYDKDTVHAILDSALFISAGFVQDGKAVVVPMIYGREGETIYLHGARKARIVRLLEQTEQACLNATLVDGIVFARSAFNSSMNYRSATIFGAPRLVDDRDEKLRGMRIISEHTMPGRWDELRESHEKEIKMTGVIAVDIDAASAKISSGMPDDEEEDYDISIWAGVLPLQSTLTAVQDDERLVEGARPSAAVRALEGRVL